MSYPISVPCDPETAIILGAFLSLSVFIGGLLAFEVVMVLPYRFRVFRRWRLRGLTLRPAQILRGRGKGS